MVRTHAIIMVTYGHEESLRAFSSLTRIKNLPVRRILFTSHKFNGKKQAKIHNMEAKYLKELAILRNTALIAQENQNDFDYFRNGYEILCLERALLEEEYDFFYLLRGCNFDKDINFNLTQPSKEKIFKVVDIPNSHSKHDSFVFDGRIKTTQEVISRIAKLYLSGDILSLSKYSIPYLIETVINNVDMK